MEIFTDILRQIRKGRVVEELTEQLAEVTAAVRATGKAGEITLKLKVKPMKGDSYQVALAAGVTSKSPRDDLPEGIFFLTEDGGLVRSDPNQKEMFVPVDALGDAREGNVAYTPPVRGAG
ncbi:hypothetical protein [Caulobacter sp. DWR3-1-2]|uniref:hypothetical protein n=1 Tax=Caulobacter sp. DWR3-1-2 TaxID=2804647 RepID=UPI003CEF958F